MSNFDIDRANAGDKVQIQQNHFNRFANEVGGDKWNDLADYNGLRFRQDGSLSGYVYLFDNRSSEPLMHVRKKHLRMKQ